MIEQNALQESIQLQIQPLQNHRFRLQAKDARDVALTAERLASLLFFTQPSALYGLLATVEENAVIVSSKELIELFSGKQHPFVQYVGVKEQDQQFLSSIQQVASLWNSATMWSHVVVNDQQQLELVNTDITDQEKMVLLYAIQETLHDASLEVAQLPNLLPHLQKHGWPTASLSSSVQVGFRLTEPEEDVDDWLLETVLISERGTPWVPAMRKKHAPIEDVLPKKWEDFTAIIQERHAEYLGFLRAVQHVPSNRFLSVPLVDAEVRAFIQKDLPLFQAFRIPVLLPAWLKSITETKPLVRTSASVQSYRASASLDEVLTFDWQFSIGGETLDPAAFHKLVDENREFIRAGDEWFHIDPTWLQRVREIMERADAGEWTVKDLLFQELPEEIHLVEEEQDEAEDPLFLFSMHQSLRQYVEMMMDKQHLPLVQVPRELQAELRPYQQDGLNWLMFMREHSFGACLADDMGLGKTIQLISYLLVVHNQQEVKKPSLIICPTSVMGNWQKELERFAPSLSVYAHYGSNRLKDEQFHRVLQSEQPDILLTTYGTATQDQPFLAECEFTSITIDEAQNIKNIQTKQSKAIRSLHGAHHIALTGTPIENRLAELWAIFDFIHRGYFGSFRQFSEQFIVPIERDGIEAAKHRLRTKIQPFLLRRTKDDPELQLNLPKKLEQNEYCRLTPEQAALYESFVEETKQKLQTLTGFERKGLILKMLSRLKQLCNHPALFLKEPYSTATDMLARSIKLENIVSMAAEITANGEQCLIFTQYIGMGQLIRQCLAELYDIDVPFLTGSMPKSQRDSFVEAFQKGEFPIFILSLKAGGTGLNLTAANHVLHADRWWNPAVENQATDRAYRIGQTKFVHVHKFVTVGTIEEKIDDMLQQKAALSAELIHASAFLTELTDAELDELLSF